MTPAPVSIELTPNTEADERRLSEALQIVCAEAPAISVSRSPQGFVVVGALTAYLLEVLIDRLRREFDIQAFLSKPIIGYVETVTRSSEGSAKHAKVADGRGHYAHVSVRLTPAARGSGYRISDATGGRTIPLRFMPAINQGIEEAMANGILAGYPIVDLSVDVCGGSYHDTDSTDDAFRTAAVMAFVDAATHAGPIVLEPVVRVTATVDGRQADNLIVEFLAPAGVIERQERREGDELIVALIPLAHSFSLEVRLREMSLWRGSYSISFAGYRRRPSNPEDETVAPSGVRVPLAPAPPPRTLGASLPEPRNDAPDNF
jgi:elongation factor G